MSPTDSVTEALERVFWTVGVDEENSSKGTVDLLTLCTGVEEESPLFVDTTESSPDDVDDVDISCAADEPTMPTDVPVRGAKEEASKRVVDETDDDSTSGRPSRVVDPPESKRGGREPASIPLARDKHKNITATMT